MTDIKEFSRMLSSMGRDAEDIFLGMITDAGRQLYRRHYSKVFNIERHVNEVSRFWTELIGKRVSNVEQAFYSQVSGIEADYYVPIGIYTHLILPYLDSRNYADAYSDKCEFPTLLNLNNPSMAIEGLRMPFTVLNSKNGKFYAGGNDYCTYTSAADLLKSYRGDVIVKPTLDYGGHGVIKIKSRDLDSNTLDSLIKRFGRNFTVQECIVQDSRMASFNETSVNTMRVMTYFNTSGEYECLRTVVRYGGPGSIVDNATSGGRFSIVRPDGQVDRKSYKFDQLGSVILSDKVTEFIPGYDRIVDVALELCKRLPHFDLVGWDFTVDSDGMIVLFEYNDDDPDSKLPQMCGGPLFSKEELRRLMPKVMDYDHVQRVVNYLTWRDKPGFFWKRHY